MHAWETIKISINILEIPQGKKIIWGNNVKNIPKFEEKCEYTNPPFSGRLKHNNTNITHNRKIKGGNAQCILIDESVHKGNIRHSDTWNNMIETWTYLCKWNKTVAIIQKVQQDFTHMRNKSNS